MTKLDRLLKLTEIVIDAEGWKWEPKNIEISGWSATGTLTTPEGKKIKGSFEYSEDIGMGFDFEGVSEDDDGFVDFMMQIHPKAAK